MIVINQLCKLPSGDKVRVEEPPSLDGSVGVHKMWSPNIFFTHVDALTPLFDTVSVFGEKITVEKSGVSLEVAQRMADKLMQQAYRDRAVTYRTQPTLVGVVND